MSLEQAILELSASIKLHAASLSEMAAANASIAKSSTLADARYKEALGDWQAKLGASGVRGSTAEEAAADYIPGRKDRNGPDASDTQDDDDDGELEEAVHKVETKGKTDSEAASKAAAKAATDQANADAKAAREKQAAEKAAATEVKPLDYMKEVAPVLNKAVQKDRQGVIDLLASFGAKKGADVPAAKHAELLAGAQAILAA